MFQRLGIGERRDVVDGFPVDLDESIQSFLNIIFRLMES